MSEPIFVGVKQLLKVNAKPNFNKKPNTNAVINSYTETNVIHET